VPQPLERDETFRIAFRTFEPFEAAIQREWAEFSEESGCRLQLEAVAMDHQPLYEALFEEKGLKRGDWDVAFINTDWVAEAHRAKALLDLAPLIAKDPPEDYPDGWTPSLLRLQQVGKAVLGLPYHDGPECLIYRRDMLEDPMLREVYFANYGYPLAVPETWNEFVRVAEFLNRTEQKLYGTVFAAYPDGHNTVYDVCLQLWTRGGELFDRQGKMQLSTPKMIEALEFYRAMLGNKVAVHPECRKFDSVKTGEAFARGEVVMMINWFGFAAICETSEDSKVKGKVAVAPIPHGPDGAAASLNVYWMLSVAAGSPHKKTAYRFVRRCMGRAADRQRTLEGVIGCRKSTWTDEQVNEAIPFYRKMEALHEHARELPPVANWVDLAAVIDRMVLETINTDRPIASIVCEAQQEADKLQ